MDGWGHQIPNIFSSNCTWNKSCVHIAHIMVVICVDDMWSGPSWSSRALASPTANPINTIMSSVFLDRIGIRSQQPGILATYWLLHIYKRKAHLKTPLSLSNLIVKLCTRRRKFCEIAINTKTKYSICILNNIEQNLRNTQISLSDNSHLHGCWTCFRSVHSVAFL